MSSFEILFLETMIININHAILRETFAILTLYLGIILGGYNMGFSAIAIPDIKNEMLSNSTSVIPKISATNDQLSWFGKKVNKMDLL